MKKKKYISVIIPTYNCKSYVKYTIESVINQTYKNFELIIIDDCSTDGTYEYISKLIKNINVKARILKTKKNSGTVAHPRNIGVKESKGDLICFLDSDDIWEKNKLAIQVEEYENDKTIYFTAAKYFNQKGFRSSLMINFMRKFMQHFVINRVNNADYHWFYIYNPVIVSSVLIHKKILINNTFDENINAREDYDLWIRLRKKKFKFKFQKKILVRICRRDKSMSSNLRKELITTIRSLSNVFFKINKFSKINFFLFGIILKFSITFIKLNIVKVSSLFKKTLIFITLIFFITFYSPLFWYLGKPLLYHDTFNEYKDIKNIVVFSGHGSTSYYNMTYLYRYRDIIKIFDKNSDGKIFILGRLQEIPEQKIIEKLLVSDGYNPNNINVIYEEFNNTHENIKQVSEILVSEGIGEIIFLTSPYHSRKAKLLWEKNSSVDVKFNKSYEWPIKNNFFNYALNKKIIIYEYTSILYNKFLGRI